MNLKFEISNLKWETGNGEWLSHILAAICHFPISTRRWVNLKFEISNLKCLWWWVRQVSGDAAYENYLQWARRVAPRSGACGPALSREEHYLDALRRRYSGVSRCC